MTTIEGLTDFHQYINHFIYETQTLDKDFAAQTTYRQLADLLEIAKGTARQDVCTDEYVQAAEKALIQTILQYEALHPEFEEKDFALETIQEFMTHVQTGLTKLYFEKPVVTLTKDNVTLTTSEIEELQTKLKIAQGTIAQWESGWLSGESMKNAQYRNVIRTARGWAMVNDQISLLELIDAAIDVKTI